MRYIPEPESNGGLFVQLHSGFTTPSATPQAIDSPDSKQFKRCKPLDRAGAS